MHSDGECTMGAGIWEPECQIDLNKFQIGKQQKETVEREKKAHENNAKSCISNRFLSKHTNIKI